jgi:pimeloyl-ACP methyl ester carboxylesterase
VIEQRTIEARGLTFRALEADGGGEPVLLLHGFPETSAMWTGMLEALEADGYHCLAPDMRGYSPDARPSGVDAYRYEELAADTLAFGAELGERYHLVGHDWGALVGWVTLATDPSPIASYTAMSCAHYDGFARAVWEDPEEELYRGILDLFCQQSGAAEAALTPDVLRTFWNQQTPERLDTYVEHFAEPGALTAALNYYRVSRGHRRVLEDFPVPPVVTPTLLLWGRNDPAVRRMTVDLAAERMTGEYRVVELDAEHWLVDEQPEQVLAETLQHVRAHSIERA